jgi:hypothetical protein
MPAKEAKKTLPKTCRFLPVIQQEHPINCPHLLIYYAILKHFNNLPFTDFSGCSGQEDAGVRGCSGWGWLKS